MEDVTRAFVQMVEQCRASPAQWAHWHMQRLGELLADPIHRLELGAALQSSGELLATFEEALDSVGEVIADAGIARREGDRAEAEARE